MIWEDQTMPPELIIVISDLSLSSSLQLHLYLIMWVSKSTLIANYMYIHITTNKVQDYCKFGSICGWITFDRFSYWNTIIYILCESSTKWRSNFCQNSFKSSGATLWWLSGLLVAVLKSQLIALAYFNTGISTSCHSLSSHVLCIIYQFQVTKGYKRPDWRSKLPPYISESEKRVRFTRPTTRSSTKSKSQTMVDAVRKTLNDEKWRERIQHKVTSLLNKYPI